MDDNNDLPPVTNIIDFMKMKPGEKPREWPASNPTLLSKDKNQHTAPVVPQRRFSIILEDDQEIEVEGFLGLHNSFLVIGDPEGNIRFAAAAGRWLFVSDITNQAQEDDSVETEE